MSGKTGGTLHVSPPAKKFYAEELDFKGVPAEYHDGMFHYKNTQELRVRLNQAIEIILPLAGLLANSPDPERTFIEYLEALKKVGKQKQLD